MQTFFNPTLISCGENIPAARITLVQAFILLFNNAHIGNPDQALQINDTQYKSLTFFYNFCYNNFIHIDVIFAGHTRQGLKCKMCRMNVHPDCQEKVIFIFLS